MKGKAVAREAEAEAACFPFLLLLLKGEAGDLVNLIEPRKKSL